ERHEAERGKDPEAELNADCQKRSPGNCYDDKCHADRGAQSVAALRPHTSAGPSEPDVRTQSTMEGESALWCARCVMGFSRTAVTALLGHPSPSHNSNWPPPAIERSRCWTW